MYIVEEKKRIVYRDNAMLTLRRRIRDTGVPAAVRRGNSSGRESDRDAAPNEHPVPRRPHSRDPEFCRHLELHKCATTRREPPLARGRVVALEYHSRLRLSLLTPLKNKVNNFRSLDDGTRERAESSARISNERASSICVPFTCSSLSVSLGIPT